MAKQVTELFKTLAKANPNPTTELVYHSTFELLIAVILSAQATDVSVNKATKDLFAKANTAEAMLDLGIAGLRKHIRSIGLYNSKADNIIATCKILRDKYNGEVPATRAELEALPGVGRKTANVVLNTAFGQPTIAVDTHILRVSNRLGLARSNNPNGVELELNAVIPDKYKLNAHHWLILHGRYVCRARNPNCGECEIRKFCDYYLTDQPKAAP